MDLTSLVNIAKKQTMEYLEKGITLSQLDKDNIEIWWPVVGSDEKFLVSNFGNIKNNIGDSMTQGYNAYGYSSINLNLPVNNEQLIHRIVAKVFVKNDDINKKNVLHQDFDKQNNRAANLKWATVAECIKHSHKNPKRCSTGTPIFQIDPNTNEIVGEYKSLIEAQNITGFHSSIGIALCCRANCYGEENQQYKEFIWRYVLPPKKTKYEDDEEFIKIDEITRNGETIKFDNYAISNYGKVLNINRNYILGTRSKEKKEDIVYHGAMLPGKDKNNEKVEKRYTIHFLVAYHFVKKWFLSFEVVDHIDENKHNNYYKNLMWVKNIAENTAKSLATPVKITNLKNNEIYYFRSATEGATQLKKIGFEISDTSISNKIDPKRNKGDNIFRGNHNKGYQLQIEKVDDNNYDDYIIYKYKMHEEEENRLRQTLEK